MKAEAFRRYLTEEEQRRLLRSLHLMRGDALARRDGALMRLLLHTGMRIGETMAMNVGDAMEALRTGYIFIPKAHRKGQRADHTVLVTEPVREALRDVLAARVMLAGERVSRVDAPLVVGAGGEGISVRAFELRCKQWAARAGLPEDFTPHWLRHTRAKNIVRRSEAKNPLAVVQAALGHASLSSTGVYVATDKEELAEALERTDGPGNKRRVRRGLRVAYAAREACHD